MSLPLRFLAAFAATLLACAPALAQKPVAPEPHLALDELVKEYKRLGLPLPPANAELVRVHVIRFRGSSEPDELGFRIPPTKSGEDPSYLVGTATETTVLGIKLVKPASASLKGIRPEYVSDLLCLAVQCRDRGWNDFAALLYARAQEAIIHRVPEQLGQSLLLGSGRVNGWELRAENSSVSKELRLAAEAYWHPRVMDTDSDRAEVLRYLRVLYPGGHDDIRDLERTLAPRKSKPGTIEALIDDLIDWMPDDWTTPGKHDRGRVAFWKLAELGFDAVPVLLEHLGDERLTRYEQTLINVKLGPIGSMRVRIRHVVGQILNDLSGRELGKETGPQLVEPEAARAWWEKARKEGEEKWLVAHAVPEYGWGSTALDANKVLFRVLGAKYPTRLGEFYRSVLAKYPRRGSHALAGEVAVSKLPRADKLALLVEGAEHKSLSHRLASLTAIEKLDRPLFRKHLLATLQNLPPVVEKRRTFYGKFLYQEAELASLVWKTDDSACWDALAEVVKQSEIEVRIEIIRQFYRHVPPNRDKQTRRELLRFLIRFLSDESAPQYTGPDGEEFFGERLRNVTNEVLAAELGLKTEFYPRRGPFSDVFLRATVTRAAAEELARLKK